MVADLKRSRPDMVYLRRRVKREAEAPRPDPTPTPSKPISLRDIAPKPTPNPAPRPEAVQVNNPTPAGGISLRRPEPEVTPARQDDGVRPARSGVSLKGPDAVVVPKPAIPFLRDHVVLGRDTPVVRLSGVQSGVGTLAIMRAAYGAWEDLDGNTGFLYLNDDFEARILGSNPANGEPSAPLPEVPTQQYGNRPLVEFHKDVLVVSLRHVRNLKRLIIAAVPGEDMIAGIGSGATLTLPYQEDSVIYLSVVRNQVELRLEHMRRSMHETFRIGTYHPPAVYHANSQSQPTPGSLQDFFSNNR